ncbi:MAG: hypothetical protein KJZ90_01265 [Rhodocyclaceae bacterium]|jgi:hypothetical protein|nr:hypothetical protein [Rhodocyclaceae bacterium]
MKAQVGDYIKGSVKDAHGNRKVSVLKVVRLLNEDDPQIAAYELEDASMIGDWEIGHDDVLLESEAAELL